MDNLKSPLPRWIAGLIVRWLNGLQVAELQAAIDQDDSILELLRSRFGKAVQLAPKMIKKQDVGVIAQMGRPEFELFLEDLLYWCGDAGMVLWENQSWYFKNMQELRDALVSARGVRSGAGNDSW